MADEPAPKRQTSRVALVSGGNRGLGFEVARRLAAIGHTVVLGSRDVAKGEAAARIIDDSYPGRVVAARLDVTKPSDIEQLAAMIGRRFAALDVLINNAAIHYDTRQTAI
jgi:NAD(P)-dependent dehydrogenase (short-subunit alcohol dehydrogenase family)